MPHNKVLPTIHFDSKYFMHSLSWNFRTYNSDLSKLNINDRLSFVFLSHCLFEKKFLGKKKNLSLTTALEQAELKW